MRNGTRAIPRALAAFLLASLLFVPLFAAKKNAPAAKMVDSGTFGIFINGRRVASEKFQIEQTAEASVAKSELLMEGDKDKAAQTAELTLTPSGDLVRYEWKELLPEKAQAIVEPQNEFLVERVSGSANQKPLEQPYILPTSTMIADDYFFSQREILIWRYLSGCQPEQGKDGCALTKSQYGVLVPRQRSPIMVTIEYVGKEKVTVKGQEQELNRFNLNADGIDWALWCNPQNHKLVRIVIAADNTEVVRE